MRAITHANCSNFLMLVVAVFLAQARKKMGEISAVPLMMS